MTVDKPKRKLFTVRNIIIGSGILVISCCLLGVILTQIFPSEPETSIATSIGSLPTQVVADEPEATPVPTNTPIPTDTPEPTSTPLPTNTPTPIPTPIEFTGQGDSIIELEKWPGAALLQINNSGSSNFVVWTYDADGNQIDLLVNTIGNYQGTRPIEFLDGDTRVTRLAIESSGSWQINVLPLAMIRKEPIPGVISGTGDDVIFLDGKDPDLLVVDAGKANSNFVVYTYGNGVDLLINEIAPYTGTLPLRKETIVIEVVASGPWTLEITTR